MRPDSSSDRTAVAQAQATRRISAANATLLRGEAASTATVLGCAR